MATEKEHVCELCKVGKTTKRLAGVYVCEVCEKKWKETPLGESIEAASPDVEKILKKLDKLEEEIKKTRTIEIIKEREIYPYPPIYPRPHPQWPSPWAPKPIWEYVGPKTEFYAGSTAGWVSATDKAFSIGDTPC